MRSSVGRGDFLRDTVSYWKKYFREKEYYLGVDNVDFLLRSLRKQKRELQREEEMGRGNTLRYRRGVLDDLVMSNRLFLEGDYLDIGSFLRERKGSILSIKSEFNLSSTYRLVSSNPSLGNLDSFLKKAIVPREGYKLVSLDYKHQEPWIIVNLLENSELKSVLDNSNDFYRGLMKKFKVVESAENRELMKKVWNTSIYGSSLNAVKKDGEGWIDDLYEWINGMSEIRSLRDKVERNIRDKKEVYTKFGLDRRVSYDGKTSIRKAFNYIFQMSASGVLYTGLNNIHSAVRSGGFDKDISVYLTNHDEYILEVSEEWDREDLFSFLKGVDFEVEGWTSPKFELKIGENWGVLL